MSITLLFCLTCAAARRLLLSSFHPAPPTRLLTRGGGDWHLDRRRQGSGETLDQVRIG
jgi:hypothetical protein